MMTILQVLAETDASELDNFTKMSSSIGFRLLIDLATIFILIRFIYFPIYKNREFFFMFTIFNIIIFFISFLLNKVELSMGAAFGLFAVFSMLRYRTESISIKEMTYLFLCIAIGLLTAVTKIKKTPNDQEYVFLSCLMAAILLITWLLESSIFGKKEASRLIVYENIELIQSARKEELMADIRTRTGINVHRVAIQRINFLKDSAVVKIYYYE
jgi:hypothetical protein